MVDRVLHEEDIGTNNQTAQFGLFPCFERSRARQHNEKLTYIEEIFGKHVTQDIDLAEIE